MSGNFKVGDKVRYISKDHESLFGKEGYVTTGHATAGCIPFRFEGALYSMSALPSELEKVEVVLATATKANYDVTKATTKVYLAGPMTGIEHYNFPAFKAAAAYLRSYGYEVFNPAENDLENGFDATGLKGHEAEEHGFDLRKALKQDLSWICDHADVLALLDGHEQSAGVAAEVALAKALGLRQFHFTRLTGGIPA